MTRRNRVSLTRMERQILSDTSCEKPAKVDSKIMLNNKTIVKKVMVNRIRYHRHIEHRHNNHILRVAKCYRIAGKFKVGRPCFIWEHSLKKEAIKVGTNHMLDLQHERNRAGK